MNDGPMQLITSNLKRFVVLQIDIAWHFHVVVRNEVVDHLEPVEEGILLELVSAEEEADGGEGLFVLVPGKVSAFRFFVVWPCRRRLEHHARWDSKRFSRRLSRR